VGLGAAGCACTSKVRVTAESAALACGVLTCIMASNSTSHTHTRHCKKRQEGADNAVLHSHAFLPHKLLDREEKKLRSKDNNK